MVLPATPNANRISVNTVIYFENAMLFVPFDTLTTYILFTEHREIVPLCLLEAGAGSHGEGGCVLTQRFYF